MDKKRQESISAGTVGRVAALAKIRLSKEESEQLQKDLNEILSAFRQLDKANTSNVQPSFQPLPVQDVFREDVVEECLPQQKALENTAHKEKGFFKGPRVI